LQKIDVVLLVLLFSFQGSISALALTNVDYDAKFACFTILSFAH